MIKSILLTAVCFTAGLSTTFAQPGSARERQASEYKRLSDATSRAFSAPQSNNYNNSYKSPSSSPSSSSSGGSSGSSSGSVGTYSSNYNPYAAEFARKQAYYAKKLEAQENAWNEKIAKVRSFLASSGIVPNTKEKHEKFFFAAYGAGLDIAAINTVIKGNAETYNKFVARENGMNENYIGSTKKDCSGNCVETVSYVNGSGVYTGNTKDGAPHGFGTLLFPNGTSITGQFHMGAIVGGKVKIVYAATAENKSYTYEGGYSNGEQNGIGVTTWGPDDIEEATYKDGAKQGAATLYRNGAVIQGLWKDDKMIGKHTWTFKSGYVVQKDMDDPNKKETILANAKFQLPPPGVKKFTSDVGTIYEGDVVVAGKPINGKFTYKDGIISAGLHDKDGYLLKGKTIWKDGSTTEGIHEKGYITSGKTIFANGDLFDGTYDKKGYLIKGKISYNNGTTEEGTFENGALTKGKTTYKDGFTDGIYENKKLIKGKTITSANGSLDGTYENGFLIKGKAIYSNGDTFTGEYYPDGTAKIGELSIKGVEILRGFFGPNNTRLGYLQTVKPDGRVYEQIYINEKTWTLLVFRNSDGSVFSGKDPQNKGYKWFGVNKDAKGEIYAAVLNDNNELGLLPEAYHAAAKEASANAQKAIQEGRAAYLEAMKWNPNTILK